MEKGLEKNYGLGIAIAMVIGTVVGSGVFFKAEKVLTATGGDLPTGILAWIIGGLIMIICAYAFSILATRNEKVNGIVDYAEMTVGSTYGYLIGWFMITIYYPSLTAVLAWVAARYTGVLLGWDIAGPQVMVIAAFFLILSYVINALSPNLAGKVQVSATVIKLIPLALMAVIGTISGVRSGVLVQNFTSGAIVEAAGNPLFTALVATAFAYEGWIVATSINAELKNPKKNLHLALTFGTAFIVIIYILYYIGLSGAVENSIIMAGGEKGAKLAFSKVFSNVGGSLLFVFVIISCLGTLNGLMVACTRGMYFIATRNMGPKPEIFKAVDSTTGMPTNSAVVGLLLASLWLVYFYGANLTEPWFGVFSFDSSEIPIVTMYALYIPIFVMMIKKEKDLGVFKRFIAPGLTVCCCVFMIIAGCYSHGMAVVYYLIVFLVIMALGLFLMNPKSK